MNRRYDSTPTSFDGLDESQQRFCSAKLGPSRLIAAAGSGKTTTLLWRCKRLAEIDDQRNRFLLFTFTRAARDELLHRLHAQRSFKAIRDRITISTLNSYGYRVLKNRVFRPELITTNKQFYYCVSNTLRPIWSQHPLICDFVLDNKFIAHKEIISLIDTLKSLGFQHIEMESSNDIRIHFKWLIEAGLEQHVKNLIDKLSELQLVEFDDIDEFITHFTDNFFAFWRHACKHLFDSAVFTLEDQKYWALLDIASKTKDGHFTTGIHRYSHVFVDEFQDVNVLDLNLLMAIADNNKAKITIVGDDDQAIYEWRGATPNFLVNAHQFLGDSTETYVLQSNYRSPKNIVDLSNRLISNNRNRVPKHLKAAKDFEASVEVLTLENLSATIDYILNEVTRNRLDNNADKIAIIGRKRSQIIPYQIVFAGRDIAFCAAEDLNLFLSEAFEQLRKILAIKMPKSHSTGNPIYVVDAILNLSNYVKRYQLSKRDREGLRSHLSSAAPTTIDAGISSLRQYRGPLKGKNVDGRMSHEFAYAINSFFAAKSVSATINALSEAFRGLHKDYGKSLEDIFYADPPFLHLSELAETYGEDHSRFIADVDSAISTLFTSNDATSGEVPSDIWNRSLHLMTALRAKGKEFDSVFILDANEVIWPSKLAVTAQQLEQERRVFYVAMTRARKRLVFLCNKTLLGKEASPSRYLREMGLVP